jgi:hypothetical protein
MTDYRIPRLCLVALLLFSSGPAVRSQTPTRFLVWSSSPVGSNNESVAPGLELSRQIKEVEIVEFLVGGREINIAEGFSAPDDFLRTMSFKVKNVSKRMMSRIQITLIVRDDKPYSPQIIYCYGCAEKQREKGIAPGEVVELQMPNAIYEFVMTKLAEKGVTVVQRVEVSHMYVDFANGPTLYSGCIKTANPRNACY